MTAWANTLKDFSLRGVLETSETSESLLCLDFNLDPTIASPIP